MPATQRPILLVCRVLLNRVQDVMYIFLIDVVAVGAVLILCLEGGEDGKDGDVLVTVDDCDDCT